MPARTRIKVEPENESQAFAKAIRLLQAKGRSIKEMRNRLLETGYSDAVSNRVCQRLTDCLLLDDISYAESYIRGKLASGWGQARIERELANKGIDVNSLEGYPNPYFSDDNELNRALEALGKHRTSAKNARNAHFRHLISKGFSLTTATRALSTYTQSSACSAVSSNDA